MSRAYRIHIAESLTRHVVVDGGVESRLDLLPIATPGRTREIVREELAREGFEPASDDPDTWVRRVAPDAEVRVTSDGKVMVRVSHEASIDVHHDAEVRSIVADEAERARVERARVAADLATRAQAKENALARDASVRALEVLDDARAMLDRVSTATTRRALEERAAELGEIRSVEEDPETGAVTIRVRI